MRGGRGPSAAAASSSAALACILALAGCGLPSFPYLQPPALGDPTASTTWPVFKLRYAGNELEFRGFLVYYRFYSQTETTDAAVASWEDLQRKSFRRMYTADDDGTASTDIHNVLIPINAQFQTDAFDIVIDFGGFPYQEPVLSYLDRTVDVRRGVAGSGFTYDKGYYKTFTEIESFDDDAKLIWDAIRAEGTVKVLLYAVSYGISDFTTQLYSDPVFLGEIELTLK